MSLEQLPLELLPLIMQSVDTPVALYRLISASPLCLRLFRKTRFLILSAVIRNAFPGNNIKDALAILQTPPDVDQIPSFLERYFYPGWFFDVPTSEKDLLSLYRLHQRISHFMNAYYDQMALELGLSHQSHSDGLRGNNINAKWLRAWPVADRLRSSPSFSETVRLQRAFLRFELYCRVFPGYQSDPWGPDAHFDPERPASQQADLFILRLRPWEIEEMVCAYEYFYSLVGGRIDELEEKLVNAVRTVPKEKSGPEDDFVDFKDLELTELLLFCPHGRRESPHHISYMTSLGLDFLYGLDGADESNWIQLIRSNHPVKRDFLPEAIDHTRREMSRRGNHLLPDEHVNNINDPFHRNLGYSMFDQCPEVILYRHVLDHNYDYAPLRQLGYVFWDDDVIQSPDISKKFLQAMNMDWRELQKRYDRTIRQTAEQRLKGTRLPMSQMNRLEREFGTTLFGDE